jgi:hypothetical protein
MTTLLLVLVLIALLAPRFGADTRDRCSWNSCR